MLIYAMLLLGFEPAETSMVVFAVLLQEFLRMVLMQSLDMGLRWTAVDSGIGSMFSR